MPELLINPCARGWKTETLGALCAASGGDIQTGPFGSQLHASDYVISGIPSVMPQNIGDNVINEAGIARISPNDAERLSRYLLQDGDIVCSRRGDVTRRALVRPYQSGWLCGTGCLRIRLGFSVNSRFISYYLGHPNVRGWIERHAVGATMPNLNTKILGALPVAYPPRLEQDAIAEILGTLDDKISVNGRIADSCIDLAECVLSCEVHTSLGVGRIALRDAATWFSGGTPNTSDPSYWSGDIPWISAATLKNFLIGDSDRKVTQLGVAHGTKVVPPGTTLCVVRGMSLKTEFRVGITTQKVAFGQDCKAFVPRENIGAHVLAYALRSRREEILKLVDEAGHGTGRLESKALGSVELLVPTSARMFEVEGRLANLSRIAELRYEESRVLTGLRDMLLLKLMSGEIRVRDAEKVVEEAT